MKYAWQSSTYSGVSIGTTEALASFAVDNDFNTMARAEEDKKVAWWSVDLGGWRYVDKAGAPNHIKTIVFNLGDMGRQHETGTADVDVGK